MFGLANLFGWPRRRISFCTSSIGTASRLPTGRWGFCLAYWGWSAANWTKPTCAAGPDSLAWRPNWRPPCRATSSQSRPDGFLFHLLNSFLARSLEGHGDWLKRNPLLAAESIISLRVEHELVRPIRFELDRHGPDLAFGIIMGAFAGLGIIRAATYQ